MQIRQADPHSDAAACAAIYAPFVEQAAVSFEEAAPGAGEFAERIARLSLRHPFLVAVEDDSIAGFAYGSPHRERAAYRWAADVSIYLAEHARGRGLGRILYGELLERLTAQRLWRACAGITLPNQASVGLHEALGFELVGVYPGIGFKAGAWRDVAWYQRALQDPGTAGDGAPDEPTAPPLA